MGFHYDEQTEAWENNDYSYALSVLPNDDGTFTALFWTYMPGVFDPYDGGHGPEWTDHEIGTFPTFKEAEQAALQKVEEIEQSDQQFEAYINELFKED